jgi:hypothetical protein
MSPARNKGFLDNKSEATATNISSSARQPPNRNHEFDGGNRQAYRLRKLEGMEHTLHR